MGFKDKLKARKSSKAKLNQKSNTNQSNDLDQNNDLDSALEGLTAPPKKSVSKKSLFAKKKVKTNVKKPASNKKDLKRSIILLVILLVFLLAVLGYFFWNKSQESALPQPKPVKPAVVKKEVVQKVEPQKKVDTEASSTNTDTATNTKDSTDSKPVLLDEVIDDSLPENDIQAAEEIDLYTDEMMRLDEQEEVLSKQIAAKQKIESLKDEHIALLEQKIAAAEAELKQAEQQGNGK